MEKKIIMIFVVLLFAVGIAFAENNTTDTVEIEDSGNYILPISITSEGIKFDDGFIGFCIDPSKSNIQTTDKFELGVLGDSEIENNIKLAIIECYKQGKEDAMADILSQINDKGSSNDVLSAVFSSNEKIGNTAVVEIDNTTEATFEFEFLKSTDDAKSDCVAYTVSEKTIEKEEPLGASNDDNESDFDNATEEKEPLGATSTDDNKSDSDNQTVQPLAASDTQNITESIANNTTDDKKASQPQNDKNTKENTKTVINKTTTTVVNETNTTIINHNNVKTVNDTPKNDTVQDLLKAGNPILILIIVIVVAVIVAVVVKRKD